ncbi:MAG: hypothetical protein ACLQVN_03340 [Bryobacteraceae bacterium]
MRTRLAVLWLLLAAGSPAQFGLLQPAGSLDLGRSPVTQLVARGSKVYAVVSNASGSVVISIDSYLFVRDGISLGKEPVTALDVDDSGQVYVVFGGNRLEIFSPKWAEVKTETLSPPVAALVVSGGVPLAVGTDGVVRALNSTDSRFSVAKYPAPWVFFGAGKDEVGLLDTGAGLLHTLEVHGRYAVDTGLTASLKSGFVSATGTPDGRVYVMGKVQSDELSIVQCRPGALHIIDLEVPSGMSPHFMAATNDRLYLADQGGTIAFYDLPPQAAAAAAR